MLKILLIDLIQYWNNLPFAQQALWSAALVVSFLALIYSVLKRYEVNSNIESNKSFFDLNNSLSFLTVFCWTLVLLSSANKTLFLWQQMVIALILAIAITVLPRLLKTLFFSSKNIGKVIQAIPPNQRGEGKIYIRRKNKWNEIKAITVGQELPLGAPVRIIKFLEDGTALVEAIQNKVPPSNLNEKNPPLR